LNAEESPEIVSQLVPWPFRRHVAWNILATLCVESVRIWSVQSAKFRLQAPATNLIFHLYLFFGSDGKLLLRVANGCEIEGAFGRSKSRKGR